MIELSIEGSIIKTKDGINFEGDNKTLVDRLNNTPYYKNFPSVSPAPAWDAYREIKKEFKNVIIIKKEISKLDFVPGRIY